MLQILLSATLSCSDGYALMSRVKNNDNLEPFLRRELVEEIRIAMPKGCNRRK